MEKKKGRGRNPGFNVAAAGICTMRQMFFGMYNLETHVWQAYRQSATWH